MLKIIGLLVYDEHKETHQRRSKMNPLDFIYKRKSIRQFKSESVPREDIIELLQAATYAPSPKHQQNWHFIVLQNKEKIQELAEIVTRSHEYFAKMAGSEKEAQKFMNLASYYTCFKDAPVVVLVYAKPYFMIEEKMLRANGASQEVIDELIAPQSGAQGIGAAVENFLLGAANMGYGACYLTGPTHARLEIEKLIGFEQVEYHFMAMIALGIPADDTPAQPPRKPLEDVVTFID